MSTCGCVDNSLMVPGRQASSNDFLNTLCGFVDIINATVEDVSAAARQLECADRARLSSINQCSSTCLLRCNERIYSMSVTTAGPWPTDTQAAEYVAWQTSAWYSDPNDAVTTDFIMVTVYMHAGGITIPYSSVQVE